MDHVRYTVILRRKVEISAVFIIEGDQASMMGGGCGGGMRDDDRISVFRKKIMFSELR